MNTLITILLFMVSVTSFAQKAQLDLEEICSNKENESSFTDSNNQESLVIADAGFCKIYLESLEDSMVDDLEESLIRLESSKVTRSHCQNNHKDDFILPNDEIAFKEIKKDKWKIRFYASHSFTTYFDSDIKLRSTRYNVDIKDYAWSERSSRMFFSPKTWKRPGNNPSQMLDEPSNTFTVSIEKNGNEFYLSAFHPKFFQESDQIKYMKGSIDGVEVDGEYDINRPFDGYNQLPGEMELVRNENTHLQMMFELGYGKRIPVVKGRFGSIVYAPSIAAGVMVGKNYSATIKEDEWWDFDDYSPDGMTIQGFGGSVLNRVEANSKNERFGIFYENRFSYYKQDHEFLDGSQKYDLKLMGHNVGMKFMLYNPNNNKKK